MGHEKFEANINPTSDGFENFYEVWQIQLVMTFLPNYRLGFNSF